MRVLIASDKFKGSLTGAEVAAALAEGLRSVDPTIRVDAVPVADGGEGTVDAALSAGFFPVHAAATGPTGVPVTATFAVRGETAIIEMAAASGLDVLPDGVLAARTATSRGTGDLIRAALDHGCTSIVLGIGGSANTDGGAGMLQALGAQLLDADGAELAGGGAALANLVRVDLSGLDERLATTHVVLASDVDNPLLGERGTAAVFGPQKGASAADVALLDAALTQWDSVLQREPGVRAAAEAEGAGGAGGVGYGALAVLGASREPGIDVIQRLTGLAERIADADLVITGEGSLDEQTLGGKTPIGVAQAAAAAGIPVLAVCGRTTLSPEQLSGAGFVRVYSLQELEPDTAKSMANAAVLLRSVGARIAAEAPSFQ